MSVQVEKLEKNMAKLTIEVAPEELEKAIEGAYQKNKGKISVPGFRKGKVPRQMIERMYGKEVFYEDAVNALIPEAYEKAVDECEEEIVSSPKIEVEQVEEAAKQVSAGAENLAQSAQSLAEGATDQASQYDAERQSHHLLHPTIESAPE